MTKIDQNIGCNKPTADCLSLSPIHNTIARPHLNLTYGPLLHVITSSLSSRFLSFFICTITKAMKSSNQTLNLFCHVSVYNTTKLSSSVPKSSRVLTCMSINVHFPTPTFAIAPTPHECRSLAPVLISLEMHDDQRSN